MLVDKSVFSEPLIFLAIATWHNSKGSCDHVGHELVKAGVRRDYADFAPFECAPWLILQSDKPNNKMKCSQYESVFFVTHVSISVELQHGEREGSETGCLLR